MSLNAIGIISKDLTATIKFYGILGIEFKEMGGPDHLEATTPSGLRIMLDSTDLIKKINPNWKEPTGSGIVLCFIQNSPLQVNTAFKTLIDSGFSSVKDPWDAFWGQRYASISDPDGNQIDLFAALDS